MPFFQSLFGCPALLQRNAAMMSACQEGGVRGAGSQECGARGAGREERFGVRVPVAGIIVASAVFSEVTRVPLPAPRAPVFVLFGQGIEVRRNPFHRPTIVGEDDR